MSGRGVPGPAQDPGRPGASAKIGVQSKVSRQISEMEATDPLNPIHRLNVEQFHRMIEAGVFSDGDRVELIDGKMRDMTPIGPPHGSCTDSLTMIFASRLAGRAIVRVQGPLVVDDGTEVYPDLLVLKLRYDRYGKSNPTADDALLVIEVADSSLALDVGLKRAKYAAGGIRRYWVVDIRNRTVHDHRDPDRPGRRYRQSHSLTEGRLSVTIEGIEIRVDVAELLQ